MRPRYFEARAHHNLSMPSEEKFVDSKMEEREARNEKLDRLTKMTAEKHRAENIPVDDEDRLMEAEFGKYNPNLYTDEKIRNDLIQHKKYKLKIIFEQSEKERKDGRQHLSDQLLKQAKSLIPQIEHLKADEDFAELPKEETGPDTIGDKVEKLASILFATFASDLIAVGTTAGDDWRHGIDTLIIDKETGAVIGAFDEVADTQGKRYQEKINRLPRFNAQRKHQKIDGSTIESDGAILEYGVRFENGQIVHEPLKNVPILYLAIDPEHYDKIVDEYEESFNPEKTTKHAKSTFIHIINTLQQSLSRLGMEMTAGKHSQEFIERVYKLEQSLDTAKKRVKKMLLNEVGQEEKSLQEQETKKNEQQESNAAKEKRRQKYLKKQKKKILSKKKKTRRRF